jgi:hypothetical protein
VPQLSAHPLGCRSKGGNNMFKLSALLLFIASIGTAQISHSNLDDITKKENDSLVEVFPLAIGNQWEYGYYWYYDTGGPYGTGTHTDTGTVTIQIIDKIVTTDTTKWLVKETFNLWVKYDTGAFNGPTNSIDTFKLVELNQGCHRLYNDGDVYRFKQSVFPFPPFADTMVCRYNIVDTSGRCTFNSVDNNHYMYRFSFKQGVGPVSIFIDDGCTCMNGFTGIHTLRSQSLTEVADYPGTRFPRTYHLMQNYPNPFNPSTTISFVVPSRSFVSLRIFDCIGREVGTLLDEELSAGNYTRQWNAFYLPSGVYYYRLQSGSFMETKKLLLLK